MTIFTMPSLGADMEEAKLVQWLVKPGDRVTKGDVVAVVETQKGAIEIEIFESGHVSDLLAQVGQTLPVGAPLARLDDEAAAPVPPAQSARAPAPPASSPVIHPAPHPATTSATGLASPAARSLAAERGLSLESIKGSGTGGAVLLGDVERFAAAKTQAEPAPPETGKPRLDMAAMRRAIATAMSRSKRDIPHYYMAHDIDLQAAQTWLAKTNADRTPETRLLMGALLVRATVKALAKTPELNGRYEAEPYAPAPVVHCGLAIAMRGGGLIAPAILNAETLDLDGIMSAMRDLVTRTRTGRLRNSELTKGTVTVSSLGESGVDALMGVIYPPQVALVGFGTPRLKPMVHDGTIQPRWAVTATLAADHRISDGRLGGRFLSEIDQNLQGPEAI